MKGSWRDIASKNTRGNDAHEEGNEEVSQGEEVTCDHVCPRSHHSHASIIVIVIMRALFGSSATSKPSNLEKKSKSMRISRSYSKPRRTRGDRPQFEL
jgi:hypothetical protein